jgi:hypothetical protein
MKNKLSFSVVFFLFILLKVNAQNEIYIVTEKYDGIVSSPPTFDSVYVTNPMGITTKYSIPSYITNQAGHDSQFNVILNGITSLGYKFIKPVQREGISSSTLANPYCIIRTIYLAKTWLASVNELSEGDSTQISVKVFPNPTLSLLNLEVSSVNDFERNEVIIFNQLGFVVFSIPINYHDSKIITIDVSSLKAGTYLLSIKNKIHYSKPCEFIKLN